MIWACMCIYMYIYAGCQFLNTMARLNVVWDRPAYLVRVHQILCAPANLTGSEQARVRTPWFETQTTKSHVQKPIPLMKLLNTVSTPIKQMLRYSVSNTEHSEFGNLKPQATVPKPSLK